jgi:hypothetical protein
MDVVKRATPSLAQAPPYQEAGEMSLPESSVILPPHYPSLGPANGDGTKQALNWDFGANPQYSRAHTSLSASFQFLASSLPLQHKPLEDQLTRNPHPG